MTPKEKWDRLNNPKTLEDYSLCMSEEELGTFEAGRKILAGAKQAAAQGLDQYLEVAKSIGMQARKTLDDVALGVIKCQTP